MRNLILLSILGLLTLGVVQLVITACRSTTGGPTGARQTACVSKAAQAVNAGVPQVATAFHDLLLLSHAEATRAPILAEHSKAPRKSVDNNIFMQIDDNRKALACSLPPLAIDTNENLIFYPDKQPNCVRDNAVNSAFTSAFLKANGLLRLARYAGKLEIQPPKDASPTMWGTGFRIAPEVVATTCHNMESLLPQTNYGSGDLELDGQAFDVHFRSYQQDSGDIVPERVCGIKKSLGCSQLPGVDVALLLIESCTDTLGKPVVGDGFYDVPTPLFKDDPDKLTWLAVIGYGDPTHPIDADTDDLFRPYYNHGYEKFLSIDKKLYIDDCNKENHIQKVILDAADTTVGESGGLVEAWAVEEVNPLVAGMHTCCATFFSDQRGTPPSDYLNCAKLHRTFDNQAISTWDILNDHTLCTILYDHKGLPGYHCP